MEETAKMKEVLIVDGYNMIGAWSELKKLKQENLEQARDRLLEWLKEYQAYSGRQVILVFDAHQMGGGQGGAQVMGGVQVIYTKANETADERIERLVYEAAKSRVQIYVATSDAAEQQVTFGGGALRISALELQAMVREAVRAIREQTEKRKGKRNSVGDLLDPRIAEILEKWRRKKDE